jgi:hypothetical protein
MGAQDTTKTITTKAKTRNGPTAVTPEEQEQQSRRQRKRPESRFCLQVDRQTKAPYATYEAAEQAALAIKKGRPIVRVAIYDTVECVNKVIELPRIPFGGGASGASGGLDVDYARLFVDDARTRSRHGRMASGESAIGPILRFGSGSSVRSIRTT